LNRSLAKAYPASELMSRESPVTVTATIVLFNR
jgi:hypothetical protein